MTDIDKLAREIGDWARSKGWWDADKVDMAPKLNGRNLLELDDLIHTEIAEATEEARKGKLDTYYSVDGDGYQKPEGYYSELADAVIRIMDIFDAAKKSLAFEILLKMRYNEQRSERHGGKLA